ncbi:uncharacterized protein PV07_09076 [Cladophialophora immunda]|uniref:Uncharacterized protein n=1 Tax=Cladophialophora immunda TaxID=569365 RepID=A0A0D2ALM0_9EURO|nr:uncharacterized protein PV07_09076 [Cladophialophora immunda]KIW25942.1 hypothetical protein PV07_09076 [Cladophialophora immunda]
MANSPGVGHEFPPFEVSWLKRDLLIFANSIGCTSDELHYLYERHPDFQPFPTYPMMLLLKRTDVEVIDFTIRNSLPPIPGVPQFSIHRLDGSRSITLLKPLPPTSEGQQFVINSRVSGVWDKQSAGSLVEVEYELLNVDTGTLHAKAKGSIFYMGQGGWGGPKGTSIQYPPPQGRKPDLISRYQTTPETPLLFRLNGDYNPLHAYPPRGKEMGFGGVVIHGLFTWNVAAHALLKELGGNDPANLRHFEARFASPVRPGDLLVTQAWQIGVGEDGIEEIRFITTIHGGKVCLSNGRALMRVVGKESRL